MAEHHILHVRTDEHGDDEYSITCPHDPDDMSRPCVMWWECRHPMSDQDRDRLYDVGEEVCPEGAPGIAYHSVISAMVCHPSRWCFVARADHLSDAASDLGLAPGDYPVDFDVEDFTDLRLLRIEAARGGDRR